MHGLRFEVNAAGDLDARWKRRPYDRIELFDRAQASMTETSSNVLTREIRELAQVKIIRAGRRTLEFLDLPRLEHLVGQAVGEFLALKRQRPSAIVLRSLSLLAVARSYDDERLAGEPSQVLRGGGG